MAKLPYITLLKELKGMEKDPVPGTSVSPAEEHMLAWDVIIFGPMGTPYEGGMFQASLKLSEIFPTEPPEFRFITKMYHPNIYEYGHVCLHILEQPCTSVLTMSSILSSIKNLLRNPNLGSPVNAEAASLYSKNRPEYNRRVKEMVEKDWPS